MHEEKNSTVGSITGNLRYYYYKYSFSSPVVIIDVVEVIFVSVALILWGVCWL